MNKFANLVNEELNKRLGEDAVVRLSIETKNNGLKLTAISLCPKDANMGPTMYLENIVEETGYDVDNVCNKIIELYEKACAEKMPDIDYIKRFETAKDKVCFRLINAARNAELLETIPFKKIADLAIVYYIFVEDVAGNNGSILIRNELLNMWGVTVDNLHEVAKNNTPRLLKGNVFGMMAMCSNMFENDLDADECTESFSIKIEDESPMHIATNTVKIYGAAVILYEGLLDAFAKTIGGSFYILPSSVHEVLFVFKDGIISKEDAGELRELVCDVNTTEVASDEILSYEVYAYDAETKNIVIV